MKPSNDIVTCQMTLLIVFHPLLQAYDTAPATPAKQQARRRQLENQSAGIVRGYCCVLIEPLFQVVWERTLRVSDRAA